MEVEKEKMKAIGSRKPDASSKNATFFDVIPSILSNIDIVFCLLLPPFLSFIIIIWVSWRLILQLNKVHLYKAKLREHVKKSCIR